MPHPKLRSIAPAVLLGVTATLLAACSLPIDERLGTDHAAAGTDFPNDKTAYDYFAAKGLTNFQAAGIVGNLDQESGVDPGAVQQGGPGRGIAQWSVGGRWDTDQGDNLLAYATQQGQASSSLTLQLDFVWFELQSFPDYGLAKLQQTTNVTDATVAFETDFEGCASCDEATRISYAKDVLAAYGADPVLTDAGTSHDASSPGDAGAGHDASTGPGNPTPGDDSGAPGEGSDAGTTGSGSGSNGDAGSTPASSMNDASSGCAVVNAGIERTGSGAWLVVVGLVLAVTRRRSSR